MVLLGIVDDAQPGFIVYSGSQWTHSNRPSYYNRTVTECQAGAQGTTLPPSFSFSFYGTTVNLFGGPITSTTAFSYSVDGAVLSNAIVNPGTLGKIGAGFWSLTGLSSASEHTLKIVPTAGLFSLDYITFTPTTLTTQVTRNLNVVYDDDDSALQYSGNWSNNLSAIPNGVPYGGTRKGSSTQGNTMKLNFIGSSITVNGLLNQGPGTLSASFAVDGGRATTFSPFNGSQQVNTSSWAFAQPFYHQDLPPGTHSLFVTVGQATESQVLWIDSVVFGATTNTSITGVVTNTSGTSSGGPGKKIIGIAAGVIGFLIITAIISVKKGRSRPRPRPPLVVVEQPLQIIQQETHISIPLSQQQPQRYAPYDPYHYSPMPRPDFAYGSEATLPMADMYPSPPPPQTYYRPTTPPARNEPPRKTYTAPQHVKDGLDFHSSRYDTPQHVDDGLDFTPSPGTRNPQRSTTTTTAPASTSVPVHHPQDQDQTQGDGRNFSAASKSNPTRPRPRSPPQQDGSDGPSQQQWHQQQSSTARATFGSDQLDGSESFTRVKPNTTVLSYHLADGSSGASGNVDIDHSTSRSRVEEGDVGEEPPPYIP